MLRHPVKWHIPTGCNELRWQRRNALRIIQQENKKQAKWENVLATVKPTLGKNTAISENTSKSRNVARKQNTIKPLKAETKKTKHSQMHLVFFTQDGSEANRSVTPDKGDLVFPQSALHMDNCSKLGKTGLLEARLDKY